MPTSTYDLIASNVLGSSASSVTFSSIPATYRDLILVIHARANSNIAIQLNSDTGSNYSRVSMLGTGSVAQSSSTTGDRFYIAEQAQSNTVFVQYRLQFFDYSATDKHKPLLVRGDNANAATMAEAHRWASTSAINSIFMFSDGGGVFASGSSFYLYGISA